MATHVPVRLVEGCEIVQEEHYLRGVIGPGLAQSIQACYHELFHACVQRDCRRVLVIGKSKWDAFSHLAARDALRSIVLAGLPARFRIAFVPTTAALIAVYDAALVEAWRLGIEAKRFPEEAEAARWLAEP
jgi:hypothetical protein